MTQEELKALTDQVGSQTSAAIAAKMAPYEAQVTKLAGEVAASADKQVSKETFDAYKVAADTALAEIKEIAKKQGTTIEQLSLTLDTKKAGNKSIAQVLKEDEEELKKIFKAGNGRKSYMVTLNKEGQFVMRPFDETASKTTGAEATVADIPTGAVAAISQALDAATLLRVGAGSPIYGQYRNTPWVFDLCNTITGSYENSLPFAMWFDEQVKVGASATTAEGTAKPASQYIYKLQSSPYKKEATIIGFTEEFRLDFAQLEADIQNKARMDVINRVNSAILPNITTAATAYNTDTSFKQGTPVPGANDFDAIAAMAAQVDDNTFGARANAAVMSTFKKWRMGIQKNTQNSYLNPPTVMDGISFVGNPAMNADDVMVGDFKQYNILLRGGLIVRVGYNGTDFAQNMFSEVLEQFYFDYISTVRKKAIVKGPDFATVKGLIAA